jgi:organic hydroperoxide reductase OsmC/OhrA
MNDVALILENRPGALAAVGLALGRAGLSIEGGGAFSVNRNECVAHFLVADGEAARRELERAGFQVSAVREVVVQRLDQEKPGELGNFTAHMAEAGVNIDTLYSDHEHRLILVVDDPVRAQEASQAWRREPDGAAVRPLREIPCHVRVDWTGNEGEDTRTYRGYRRDHLIGAAGKTPIEGSSDPAFHGDARRYNPEEMFVASLSACHMLWYLHLCAVNGVAVSEYHDDASGTLAVDGAGSGDFVRVLLKPHVTVAPDADEAKALALHGDAHAKCFLAKAVNVPVEISPSVIRRVAGG